MMFRLLFFILLCTLLDAASISRQQIGDIAQKLHIANINALLIFTSQSGLNSGRYHFDKAGSGVTMHTYNLPFTYHFEKDGNYNYFFMGNVGYSSVEKDEKILGDAWHNYIHTYTAGAGGGVRYFFTDNFSIMGGVELIYSRAGLSVNPPGGIDDSIKEFFNDNYNDNLTWKFLLDIAYEKEFAYLRLHSHIEQKIFDTKSDFTFKNLTSITTQSALTTFLLSAESFALYSYGKNFLTLEAYYSFNYLHGEVTSIVNFSTYHKSGLALYYNTPKEPSWASRFFLEGSMVEGSGIQGYNLGIGFSVDF
jgi:hypothetical protein